MTGKVERKEIDKGKDGGMEKDKGSVEEEMEGR